MWKKYLTRKVAKPSALADIYTYAGITPKDALHVNENYGSWKHVLPIPPLSLIKTTGATNVEKFYVVGEAWAHLITSFLKKDSAVLEIWCGCGKIARHLLYNRSVKKYFGFDIVRESVDWASNFIKPFADSRFGFEFCDVKSDIFNPNGKISLSEFEFPIKTSSVDVVFSASLFSHVLEEDILFYLKQIRRVMKKDGVAILSITCKVVNGVYSGNESSASIDCEYFVKLARKAHLIPIERIKLCGQVAIIFSKA